jgi:transposase-like protein
MKAYSQDLRQRILQRVDEGKTQAEAASLLKVSETTVKRYVRQRRETGHVQPKSIPGRPPSKRAPLEAKLQPQLDGSANTEVFEIYIEQILAPSLQPGQIVIMDNLSTHKGKKVRELIEARGSQVLSCQLIRQTFRPLKRIFPR